MLALDVWVFRTRLGDTISSTVTFWLPVDLVILFKPEWIDKLFRWLYQSKEYVPRTGLSPTGELAPRFGEGERSVLISSTSYAED